MIRFIFATLILFLVILYVLMDSAALEFRNTTLEKTLSVERVAARPIFHRDRLEKYFEKRFSQIRSWISRVVQT